MFVGVKVTSEEVWAATKEGLQAVRQVRKIRWKSGRTRATRISSSMCPGTKAEKTSKQIDIFQKHQRGQQRLERLLRGSMERPRVIVVNTKDIAPQGMLKHTDTPRAAKVAEPCGTRQPHTTECRERFRDLKDEDKVVRTLEKRKESEEKMEERSPGGRR